MATKINHDHPLYLSTSDVPKAVQIGIHLTRIKNHSLWSHSMQLDLVMKNKLGFIKGSLKGDDFKDNSKNEWISTMQWSPLGY